MTNLRRSAAIAAGSVLVPALLFGFASLAHGSGQGKGDRAVRAPVTTAPAVERDCRFDPTPIMTTMAPPIVSIVPVGDGNGEGSGGIAGTCPQEISTYTSSNFQAGSYILEAGMAEGEIAAASYVLPAAKFPIRIDLTEIIFGTSNATVTTTTHWSIMIWEGTPATGTLKYLYSSDGELIPHIVLPPGTSGVNVQFAVQAETPEDELTINDDGSHTFSIGYRIDKHNQQTANPCFVAPPSCCNAFPTVDTSGLSQPTKNWLYALDCGLPSCAGWKQFAQLAGICKPSGDWVLRATWSSYTCEPSGACCIGGNCTFTTASDCALANGTYLGDNVPCGIGGCSSLNVACCFQSTGGCLNLEPATCMSAGGVPGPSGSVCAGYICFPTGACCLPNGSCIGPVSPETCAAQSGNFQGNNTTCGATNCPQPTGACCFPNGFCLVLTQSDCALAGANWHGAGTNCAAGCNQNPADLNNDGHVNSADLGILLGAWGQAGGAADLDHDGVVGSSDLGILLGAWTG